MGQLNFFMTEEDIAVQINQILLTKNYILFNSHFFDSESPEPINNINDFSETDRKIIWIKNEKSAPRCSVEGGGTMKGKFLFDFYRDPIVELDLGSSISSLLSPGRLFYKTGWVIDKEVREIHTKMTNRLVRIFKKELSTTNRLRPFYLSKSVRNLINNGCELELGEGGMRVDKDTIDVI